MINILVLIRLALELWVMRESRREEINLRADEKELNDLRNLGDPASQLAADRLRVRITRGVGVVGRVNALPAASVEAPKGEAGADRGRDLHPAG